MRAHISNKIYIYNAIPSVIAWCETNLVVTNPIWTTLKRIGKEDTIRRRHIPERMALFTQMGADLVLPYGVITAIWNLIKNCKVTYKFNKSETGLNFANSPLKYPLYDYQERAVSAMHKAKMGVLIAPCSAGKTNMMIEMLHRINKPFLVLVHTGDLLRQFYNRAKSLFPNIKLGTITEGKVDMGEDGTIATIQTMDKLDKDIYADKFDVVVCDESAHVAGSPTLSKMFERVVSSIPARYKFGCTATPNRSDGLIKTMYTILGCAPDGSFAPVYEIKKEEIHALTAEHIKVDCNIPFNFSCLNSDGTFNYASLIESLSNNTERNELILSKAKELVDMGRKIIILTHRIEHVKTLHNALYEMGVKSVMMIGSVTNKKRSEILLEKTEWDCIVATYSLCKEGLDLPSLSGEILCTPITEKGMMIQCVGRVERYKENKPTPIVYDIVDMNYPYCVGKYKKRAGWLKRR